MTRRIRAWDLGVHFTHADADHLAPPPAPSVLEDDDDAATDAITEAITDDGDGDEEPIDDEDDDQDEDAFARNENPAVMPASQLPHRPTE